MFETTRTRTRIACPLVRIALTHAYCWPEVRRGGERMLHELAGSLARRGHDVSILSSAERPSRSMEDGVRVVRLKSPRGTGLKQELRFSRKVLPSLLTERFDVVHSLGVGDASASILAAGMHRRLRRTRRRPHGIHPPRHPHPGLV